MGNSLVIRAFEARDEEQVVSLWNACDLVVPWNDPHRDIARKVAEQPGKLLVGELLEVDGRRRVVASIMIGYDGHRGWINYLAVAQEWRRRGFGTAMMAAAEARLRAAGCPKINLQVRKSNRQVVEFYRRLGFAIDEVVCMGKRLIRDDAEE